MGGAARISGVVVLGDFLRPDAEGRAGGTDRPTRWLCNAVRRQIDRASGLSTVPLLSSADAPLAAWLDSRRTGADAFAFWAGHYASLPVDPGLEAALLRRLVGQFCLTYEAPPYLLRLLDGWGVPWLDVRLHPVRFLDDLLFAVRAARAETQAALFAAAVDEGVVLATAGVCEAMSQLISEAAVPDDTLVVVGQRPLDATQIIGGKFFDAAPYADTVARICGAHRAVVLKPHPSGDTHSLLVAAARTPNFIGTIGDNIYRVLALPQISAVLTVNSSVAYEAPYFGKHVYTLAPLPLTLSWRGGAVSAETYISLDGARVLSADFWRTALAPHAPVTDPDGAMLPVKPNRLRIALDSFWNFNEIDTDRIPHRA